MIAYPAWYLIILSKLCNVSFLWTFEMYAIVMVKFVETTQQVCAAAPSFPFFLSTYFDYHLLVQLSVYLAKFAWPIFIGIDFEWCRSPNLSSVASFFAVWLFLPRLCFLAESECLVVYWNRAIACCCYDNAFLILCGILDIFIYHICPSFNSFVPIENNKARVRFTLFCHVFKSTTGVEMLGLTIVGDIHYCDYTKLSKIWKITLLW